MKAMRIILNLIISGTITFAILAGFLYYLSSKGGSINIDKLTDLLSHISLSMIFLYLIVYAVGTWFRAKRFQFIIKADKSSAIPSMRNMYIITMIRNMVVDLLPSRSGELFYIGLIKKSDNVPTATGTSSLAMSIWFDLLVLGLMIIGIAAFGLVSGLFDVQIDIKWLIILAVVIALLPIGLWIVLTWQSKSSLGQKLYHNRFFHWFFQMMETSQEALNKGILLPCIGFSFIVRVCKYLGMYMIFIAVSRGASEYFNDISAFDILITLVASEFSASLPVPALMSFGTYEAGGTFALSKFGIPVATAALVVFGTHLVSQVVDYILGGIAMILYWTLGLAQFKNEDVSQDSQSNMSTNQTSIFKQLAALAIAGAIGLGTLYLTYQAYQGYKFSKTLNPPEPGKTAQNFDILSSATKEQLTSMLAATNQSGYLVWSSNRFGNHDILKLSLPEMKIERLTDHPNTEGYPRISPDGNKVAFVRAHKPWLSWRNFTDWDIILLDVTTGKEELLVKNAYQPNWDNDGKNIYFVGEGGRGINKINVQTKEVSNVFLTGQGDWPTKMALHTPSYNEATGNFALNYRKPLPMAGFVDINNPEQMVVAENDACQTAWSNDNTFAYYVGKGRMKNAFYKYDYQTGKSTLLFDSPTEYSHEYFPKLTRDNRFLVYGASSGGHEHDTEDYEIFIWDTQSPQEQTTRLTFHTGNDNWPDIYLK